MGDVVRTLPALRLVRDRLPKAYIAWAVEEGSRAILENHPDLDEVLVLEREALSRELAAPGSFVSGLARARRFVQELRRRGFTISLDFQGTLKSALVGLASGAPVRAGYDGRSVKESNHLFTNHRIVLPPPPVHRVARNLALLRALGVEPIPGPVPVRLPIDDEDRALADEALRLANVPPRPYVFLYPGSSARQAYKRYPIARFREVARRLLDQGVEVAVGRGPGEEDLARALCEQGPPQARLLPVTPLRTMAEIIRRSSLFIGGDTGPMHLAWIQGVPVVALFGPTDPALNAPWGPGHIVLDAAAAGAQPAGGRLRDPSVFDALDPACVADAALALLARGPCPIDPAPLDPQPGTTPSTVARPN